MCNLFHLVSIYLYMIMFWLSSRLHGILYSLKLLGAQEIGIFLYCPWALILPCQINNSDTTISTKNYTGISFIWDFTMWQTIYVNLTCWTFVSCYDLFPVTCQLVDWSTFHEWRKYFWPNIIVVSIWLFICATLDLFPWYQILPSFRAIELSFPDIRLFIVICILDQIICKKSCQTLWLNGFLVYKNAEFLLSRLYDLCSKHHTLWNFWYFRHFIWLYL